MKKDESPHNLAQQFIAIIKESFRGLHRKYKIALAVIFLAVLFTGLTLAGLLESVLYLPAAAKITIGTIVIMGAVGSFIYYYRSLERPVFNEFYQHFSKAAETPELGNALDLHFDSDHKSALRNKAIQQNLKKLNPEDIKSVLDRYSKNHPIHKYYRAGLSGALGAFLFLAGFTLLQPNAMERLANFWVSYTPPNPYSYTIEPGTLTLEQGESFTPEIGFDGDVPDDLSIAFKTNIEEEFRERNPRTIDNQQASFSPIALNAHGSYYFEMDGFRSEEFSVKVQLRPRLEQLSLQVVPPEYTQLDTTSYSYPFSKIQAYRGSEINLAGQSNKPVTQFSMYRTEAVDSVELIPEETEQSTEFLHRWTVGSTDTVTFNMADSAGLTNENKFRFVVEPREDQHPFVNLISPSSNMKMESAEPLQLEYEAGDDFGLTGASLRYELQRAFTENPEEGSVSLPRPEMNGVDRYEWDLPALDPKPRDVITFWIEVRDNDAYNGAKSGQSQKLTITFPSTAEYMEELDAQEDEVTESLENVSDSFEQMEQEYEQFKKQLRQNPETNWDQKQQLDEVEEKRDEVDQQVDELNKKFENIRNEIEKSQALSPETMETYDELQKLMKEINDPELEEALKKLRESIDEMNPDQMREALENYEFNEQQYKDRINRTLELFKSLKLNSDLDKMANSLEKLAEQEQEVSESEQAPEEDLERQQSIEKDLENVQEQLDKLDDYAPDKAKKQVDELRQNTGQQMKKTQEQLRENMEQLKKQQGSPQTNPDTKKQQQQIQKQMKQMSQQMRESKQQLNQQQMQINLAALEYILYSLIDLSINQEELTKETENLPTVTQAFVEKAREERNISNQFSILSDSLFQVSSDIPGFGNRINKKKAEVENHLSRAVEMLAERNKSNSTHAQRQSLGGINELSSMVASLIDQLRNQQQQGGSGGNMSMQQFMEQMEQMSGQQQKLNEEIQNMINDMQGNRLNQDQMERLNQLSRQQNQIRKQIQKLQRQGKLETGDRVLSELERMSEQMEDAINDLRGGQLDRNMMERQQNILSRMLNAEDAIQKRGEEDRREATTAEEQPESVPPDVTLEELQQRIRKMLNNPDRTKFTEDYQRLIEQYFELLKEQDKEVIQ